MSVTITGLDKLNHKLRHMVSAAGLRPAIAEAAAYVKSEAATYPPTRTQGQPFKTDKQRRYFFAALRSGEIQVPYRRAGAGGGLAGDWTVVFTDGGAIVGNAKSYGPYVMGTRHQSAYHNGNWKTEERIATDGEPKVMEIIARHVRREINSAS